MPEDEDDGEEENGILKINHDGKQNPKFNEFRFN